MGVVVILGLLSSVFYGASDFFGALTARRVTVIKASILINAAATTIAAAALLVTAWTFSTHALLAGLIAGAFATVGMVTFYAALAIGPMSLLAPLISLVQTSIPVIVSAVTGNALSAGAWVAIFIGLSATVLISIPAGAAVERITPRGAILALVSAITLGLSVVALDQAPTASGVFPAFLDVGTGLVLLVPLLAFRRTREKIPWLDHDRPGAPEAVDPIPVVRSVVVRSVVVRSVAGRSAAMRVLALGIVAGVLLGFGNILLVLALHTGNLAVVAVLVSLYPLATVILAWAVLKERLSLFQFGGVALAITAAVMLGLS